MKWRDAAVSFIKHVGPAARFTAKQVLNTCLPGYATLAEVVEAMLDTAEKAAAARDDRDVQARLTAQEDKLDQAAALLDVMQRQLGDVLKELAKWEAFPEQARTIVRGHLLTDPFFQQVQRTLEAIASRLEHHEKRLDDLEGSMERMKKAGYSDPPPPSRTRSRALRRGSPRDAVRWREEPLGRRSRGE